jgi:hypothetical protein
MKNTNENNRQMNDVQAELVEIVNRVRINGDSLPKRLDKAMMLLCALESADSIGFDDISRKDLVSLAHETLMPISYVLEGLDPEGCDATVEFEEQ